MNNSKQISLDGKLLFLIFILLALPIALKAVGATLVFLILCIHAFSRRENSVLEALVMSTIVRFLNPGLYEAGIEGSIGAIAVLLSSALAAFQKDRLPFVYRKSIKAWILFIAFMALASALFSDYPDVSLVKLAMLSLVVVTIYRASRSINISSFEIFLYNLLTVITFVSLPFIAVPAIGFRRNGVGFQGILGHPQTAGSILALCIALFVVLYIYNPTKFKNTLATTVVLSASTLMLMATGSRTGFFALAMGVALTALVVVGSKKFPAIRKNYINKYIAIGLLGGFMMVIFGSQMLLTFVTKNRGDGIESVYSSREGLINNAMYTIRKNPLAGIGFGVPSWRVNGFFNVSYFPGTSIPISAPIEKGVLPLAVLEEGGIIGLALFLAILFALFKDRIQINPVYLVTLFTPILINLGEANMLTSNGLGPLMLTFMFLQPQKSSWGELE